MSQSMNTQKLPHKTLIIEISAGKRRSIGVSIYKNDIVLNTKLIFISIKECFLTLCILPSEDMFHKQQYSPTPYQSDIAYLAAGICSTFKGVLRFCIIANRARKSV